MSKLFKRRKRFNFQLRVKSEIPSNTLHLAVLLRKKIIGITATSAIPEDFTSTGSCAVPPARNCGYTRSRKFWQLTRGNQVWRIQINNEMLYPLLILIKIQNQPNTHLIKNYQNEIYLVDIGSLQGTRHDRSATLTMSVKQKDEKNILIICKSLVPGKFLQIVYILNTSLMYRLSLQIKDFF